MFSPSEETDTLEAPVRSESQEDASEDEEEEEEDEEEEDDGDSSRQTLQRTPGDDGSTAAATAATDTDTAQPSLTHTEAVLAASGHNAVIAAVPNLDSLSHLREVGLSDAVSWQLSSAKPGNGVEQLRDPSNETYWQSDGVSQPHWIQIHLHRRLPVTHVALYLDYQLDESYTPKTVRVETGMTTQDLCAGPENVSMELHEPAGWCILPVRAPPDPLSADDTDDVNNNNNNAAADVDVANNKAHLIRISILSMHQNGRDTHVRRLALFCQRTAATYNSYSSRAAGAPLSSSLLSSSSSSSLRQRHRTDDAMPTNEEEEETRVDTTTWDYRQHRSNLTSDFATLGMNAYSTIR